MHNIIQFIQSLTSHDWAAFFTLLGGGVTVAVVLQTVKHYLSLQNAKKTVMFLLGLFSAMTAFANWFLQFHSANPLATTGRLMGWVVTFAIFVHRFAVSPAYYKITTWLDGIYSDAKTYRAEVAPQKVTPIDVVAADLAKPVTSPTPAPNDFTTVN